MRVEQEERTDVEGKRKIKANRNKCNKKKKLVAV